MLQAWKARKVAQHTTHLGAQTVAFVDAQAAIAGAKNRLVPNLPGLVHEALVRFEPDVARAREEAAQTHREVRFDYHGETTGCPGSATLTAELDLVDGLDLDTAVADLADHLGRLGDDSPLDERRARALGLLAHPQAVLDLVTDPDVPDQCDRDTATASRPRTGLAQWATTSTRISTTAATLYLHLDAEDLRRHTQDGDLTPGTVEKLGAASLDLIATWLGRTSGITLKPVLDMNRSDAVDAHDPPAWMRDLVTLRDGHCVFPGCTIDARRCDQDHIEPYIPIDQGGPPGQTVPANLACLCRRHHRLKTFTGWDYQRTRPGTYPGPTPTASPTRADPPPSTDPATERSVRGFRPARLAPLAPQPPYGDITVEAIQLDSDRWLRCPRTLAEGLRNHLDRGQARSLAHARAVSRLLRSPPQPRNAATSQLR